MGWLMFAWVMALEGFHPVEFGLFEAEEEHKEGEAEEDDKPPPYPAPALGAGDEAGSHRSEI